VYFDIIIKQIIEAKFNDKPFCHYWSEDFFTDELHDKLVSNLPGTSKYECFYHPDCRINTYESTRYRLILNNTKLVFWQNICDVLKSKEFKSAVFSKLSKDIYERFNTLDVVCEPSIVLYRDFCGYKIRPHPDNNRKVATCQFYIARNNLNNNLGTHLYERNSDKTFRTFRQMLFQPRSGYGFAVSKRSWHGVPRIDTDNIIRDSLMVIYYQPEDLK
jgi:hypothetical protein